MVFGVTDAAGLCREGGIPTSKIYRAMEKLGHLGLVQVQPTRPKMYAALPAEAVADRLLELSGERADHFAAGVEDLRRMLLSLPGHVRGKHPFVDLTLGAANHVKRHLVHLAMARERILSYMERERLDRAIARGHLSTTVSS